MKYITLHWTASKYEYVFDDYHYCITMGADKAHTHNMAGDDVLLPHTWHRNTDNIGIALCCCYNATSNDLGDYPPTVEQIEAAITLIKSLAKKYDIPIENIKSHGEWARIDGYYGERWDLEVDISRIKGMETNTSRDTIMQYIRKKILGESNPAGIKPDVNKMNDVDKEFKSGLGKLMDMGLIGSDNHYMNEPVSWSAMVNIVFRLCKWCMMIAGIKGKVESYKIK